MGAVSLAAKAKLKENQKKYAQSPQGKYMMQKAQAKSRGLGFSLSFEEWWKIWQESGQWENRGKAADQYCMGRKLDAGGYEVGNVEIVQVAHNIRDQMSNGRHVSMVLDSSSLPEIIRLTGEGLSQKVIAARLGVGQPHISRMLAGARGKYFDKLI